MTDILYETLQDCKDTQEYCTDVDLEMFQYNFEALKTFNFERWYSHFLDNFFRYLELTRL